MKIPAILSSLYQNDHQLSAFVTSALSAISSHVISSRMEFFPEYTDHNVSHLEGVINTATSLMTEEARSLLTPEDAAVLCVAVALHDLGMHLTKDGFATLVSEQNPWVPAATFRDVPWLALWQGFMAEATRFDGRKLRAIFGDNFHPVRHPPSSEQPWEDFDYLLVGEFLRRNHPRLAYDIALNGMPAKAGKFIRICQTDTDHQRVLAELAGLIARSHGMELRPCLTYLEDRFQNRVDPRRVRAPYLMVLLRIADFFQIQPQRAPKERTDVASFKSPLSDLEWKVHQSVSEINNSGSDPEAIVINATPPDVGSFIRLRSWLTGLQTELDKSWAVLGEVYGLQKHNLLCNLTLRIRRVRSNIDNISEFAAKVNYIPAEISFTSANTDLLKLLINPLYDGDVGVGVRELIQNAVDAVREYDDLPSGVKDAHGSERFNIEADVKISVDLDESDMPTAFEITDRGVGMTSDILLNYFLKAGASFRRSDQWKALHEDSDGQSKIIRSGRFGVGALATFLLGEQIDVETRHISQAADQGLRFAASVDTDSINVTRTQCPVGTRIKVKLNDTARDILKRYIINEVPRNTSFGDDPYGYYFSRYPELIRSYGKYKLDIDPMEIVPSEEDDFGNGWRKFEDSGFTVFWKPSSDSHRRFLCNGILVQSAYDAHNLSASPTFRLEMPHLSVYDRNGLLPINLQRSEVKVEKSPFFDRLKKDRVDDFIIHTLINAPTDGSLGWYGRFSGGSRPMYGYDSADALWFLATKGFVAKDPDLISRCKPNKAVLSLGSSRGFDEWAEACMGVIDEHTLLGQYETDAARQGNRIKGLLREAVAYLYPVPGCTSIASRVLVPPRIRKRVEALSPGKDVKKALNLLRYFDEDIQAWGEDKVQTEGAKVARVATEKLWATEAGQGMILMEIDLKAGPSEAGKSLLATRWMDILGTPIIPFDLAGRNSLLAAAQSKVPDLVKANLEEYADRKKFQI